MNSLSFPISLKSIPDVTFTDEVNIVWIWSTFTSFYPSARLLLALTSFFVFIWRTLGSSFSSVTLHIAITPVFYLCLHHRHHPRPLFLRSWQPRFQNLGLHFALPSTGVALVGSNATTSLYMSVRVLRYFLCCFV